jgi:flagellin
MHHGKVMSLAITQILSQDRQAESRAHKKLFSSSDHQSSDDENGYSVDQQTGYYLSLQCLSDIRSINQYVSNANDGISLVQIATDALVETDAALDEIRQISEMHGANYQYDPEKMVYWLKQVYSISQETNFNHKPLLDGHFAATLFTVGAGLEQSIQVSLSSISPVALGFGQNIGDVVRKWQSPAGYKLVAAAKEQNIDIVGNAQHSIADIRANLLPLHDRFENALAELRSLSDKTRAARGRIHDNKVATEVTLLTRDTLLARSKVSIQAQANQQAPIAMRLLE